jgi:hypothetical protein
MPRNNFKRAVRAYMAEHPGVSYAAAHRILSEAASQLDNPTDLDTLHSHAAATQAAIEAELGVEPGTGVDVTVYQEPDGTLAATFLLIGDVAQRTSMVTFNWTARDGWRASRRTQGGTYDTVPVNISQDKWPPAKIAAQVKSYVASHPSVQPGRARAQVTVTANTGPASMPRRWEITVGKQSRAEWVYRDIEREVDAMSGVLGWLRAPGAEWPVDPTTEPVEVEVVRSEIGERVDQVQAMYDAVGLSYHTAHGPYIAAVARELQRAGVEVEDWFDNPDEPRDGAIELTVPMPGYEQTHVAWREDQGWYYMPSSDAQALADYTVDLPVGHLAEPYDVAAAVCKALDRPFTTDRPDWRPPADYNPDAVEPEAWWDASPDLERALTCYTTYPGWKRSEAAGPDEPGREDTAATGGLPVQSRISGTATPPEGWPSDLRGDTGVAAVYRDRDGDGQVDEYALFDLTGNRVADLVVPHVPPHPVPEHNPSTMGMPGSDAHNALLQQLELNYPDEIVHRLGVWAGAFPHWHQWSDGSWRTPVMDLDPQWTHSVTVTPTQAGQRLVLIEHPDTVVLDRVVPIRDPKNASTELRHWLDQRGYTIDMDLWVQAKDDSGRRYRCARVGRLAERDWYLAARVRFTRDYDTNNSDSESTRRLYRAGEEVVLLQFGYQDRAIDDTVWKTSTTIDGCYYIDADAVEVVEVLEHLPPFWDSAALTTELIRDQLAGHPGVDDPAAVAEAWMAAGLLVVMTRYCMEIRTAEPERALLGQIRRDYRDDQRGPCTHLYQVVIAEPEPPYTSFYNREVRTLAEVPLDPYGAAKRPRTLDELDNLAHQVVNAFEQLAGLPHDESPLAVVERDGNKLAVSIPLPKDVGPTRLLGVDWSSDHGWTAIVRYVEGQPLGPVRDGLARTLIGKDAAGSGTEVFEADLALDPNTWTPAVVAAEIQRAVQFYV